jgi:hypothetical protein
MEFRATRKYIDNLQQSRYPYDYAIFVLPLIFLFAREFGWVLMAIAFMVLAIYRLARKVTTAIRIDGDFFEVEYRRFFKSNIHRFERTGILLKLVNYEDNIKDALYYVLLIFMGSKLKYEVNGRDGFSREALAAAIQAFAAARS